MSHYEGDFYSFYLEHSTNINFNQNDIETRFRTRRLRTEFSTPAEQVPNGHVYYGYLDRLLAQSVNYLKKNKPKLLDKLGIEKEYQNKRLSKLSSSTLSKLVLPGDSSAERNIFKERYYRYLEQMLHPNSLNALKRNLRSVNYDYDYLGVTRTYNPNKHYYSPGIESSGYPKQSRIESPFYEINLVNYLNRNVMREKRSMFRCVCCAKFQPNSTTRDNYKLQDNNLINNDEFLGIEFDQNDFRYQSALHDAEIQFYTVYTPVEIMDAGIPDVIWEKFILPLHRSCYHANFSVCPRDSISFPSAMGVSCQNFIDNRRWSTLNRCAKISCPDELNTQVHLDNGRDLSLLSGSVDPSTVLGHGNSLYLYTAQFDATESMHDMSGRSYIISAEPDEFGTELADTYSEIVLYSPRCFIQCDTCWNNNPNEYDRPVIICSAHGAMRHIREHQPVRVTRSSGRARIYSYGYAPTLKFYYTDNDIKSLEIKTPTSNVTHPVKPFFTGNSNVGKYWYIHRDIRKKDHQEHLMECSSIKTPVEQGYTYDKASTNTLLFLGIEFETQARESTIWGEESQLYKAIIKKDNEQHIFQKFDSTVTGVELCTHPGTLDYWINSFDWNHILRSAKQDGHFANTGSGIHVHTSIYGLGLCPMQRAETIEKLFVLMDMHYYQLSVIANRIFNVNAKPLFNPDEDGTEYPVEDRNKKHYLDTPVSVNKNVTQVKSKIKYGSRDRYKVLNINTGKKTIEFRMFKTTFNYDALISRLQIVHTLCDYALNNDMETVLATEWHDLLRHIEKLDHEHLIRYLNTPRVVRDMKEIHMPDGNFTCYPCDQHKPKELSTEKIEIKRSK